jgi:AraC family transcriptional regulator
VPASEILLHDADGPVLLGRPGSVIASSAGAGWTGLSFEHQRLPPVERAAGFMPWHTLVVLVEPPPCLREPRDAGPDVVRRFAPGDVIFHPAGVPSVAGWPGPSEVVNVAIEPGAVSALTDRVPVASGFGPNPVARHLALALLAAGRAAPRLLVDGLRGALAEHVARRYGGGVPRPRGPRRLTAAELARVRDRVESELHEDLRLADLAAAVPLSPHHFSRVFKATTGITPHAYVMQCRTDAARTLLVRGHLGLDEIARRTGFADGGHLARRVRRRFGVAPSALRR